MTSTPLVFTAHKSEPALVPPAAPTPRETKPVSYLDAANQLRVHIDGVHFYRNNSFIEGQRDPAVVIKDAIARTLVPYYPLAGRLKDDDDGEVVVDCTGEGVLFVEGDADVGIDELGVPLMPPFPASLEDCLLGEVEGYGGFFDSPLLLIQVMRLKCGGFIFSHRRNHMLTDATGHVQFLSAIAELACGDDQPSITPVWSRELLTRANISATVTTNIPRLFMENPSDNKTTPTLANLECRSFLFSPDDLVAIRTHLPPHLLKSSTFDVLSACIWKCRTKAFAFDPEDEVKLLFVVNFRNRLYPPLPEGYYGNAITAGLAYAPASIMYQSSFGHVVEEIRKAKREVTDEYVRAFLDIKVSGRGVSNYHTSARWLFLSDVSKMGYDEMDLGWGKPVYAGPVRGNMGPPQGLGGAFIKINGHDGVAGGILFTLRLPSDVMKRFENEVEIMTNKHMSSTCPE